MSELLEQPKVDLTSQEPTLAEISARLEKVSAEERVQWALERFRPEIVLSTSFGAQSAVSLPA